MANQQFSIADLKGMAGFSAVMAEMLKNPKKVTEMVKGLDEAEKTLKTAAEIRDLKKQADNAFEAAEVKLAEATKKQAKADTADNKVKMQASEQRKTDLEQSDKQKELDLLEHGLNAREIDLEAEAAVVTKDKKANTAIRARNKTLTEENARLAKIVESYESRDEKLKTLVG